MNQNSWKKHPEAVSQSLNTNGVHTPVGHPTDVDFVYDGIRFQNGVYIMGEVKCDRAPELTVGQKKLIENSISNMRCRAIGIHCTHNVYDCNQDIPLEKCLVRSVFANFEIRLGWPINQWVVYPDNSVVTVGDIFNYFFKNGGKQNV